jgi:hypothetical protein
MDELLEGAGLRLCNIRREYASGPKPLTFIYCGIAERAAAAR